MKKLAVLIAILTCMFIMLEPMNVFAIEDIDSERAKTLTVYMYAQINGVDNPIEGAEIGVTKIVDVAVVNGDMSFKVTDNYADLVDTEFRGISVSESVEIAGKFADKTANPEKVGVTAENGKYLFDIEDSGIYLVQELSASGEAAEYQLFDPYIILVPLMAHEGDNWQYDVLSEPKTAIIGATSKPADPSNPDESSKDSSEPSKDVSESSGSDDLQVTSADSDYSFVSEPSDGVLTGDRRNTYTLCAVCLMFISAFIVTTIAKKGVDRDE